MARTRQSAKKTVGEPAKVIRLLSRTHNASLASPKPTSGPSPPPTAREFVDKAGTVEDQPSNMQVDNERDVWCSGCGNGGNLVGCAFCPHRRVCNVCIPFVEPELLAKLKFICPVCHHDLRPNQPYHAFLDSKDNSVGAKPTPISFSETRGWFPRRDSTPFAILAFRLETTSDIGSPAQVIRHHVLSYFTDNVTQQSTCQFFDLPFSFPTKAAVKEFKEQIDTLVQTLENGRFRRLLVLVTTHSDPERGDLHACKGYAAPPDELFTCIFPAKFRAYVKAQNSLFVLLACGAALAHKPSFDAILQLATSGIFRATIGFTAKDFQPSRASFFLAKLTEKYFFSRYSLDPALKASLSEECGLGAHGNVIVISPSHKEWIERQYVWSHNGTRPWGMDVSLQCPHCRRLRAFGKPLVSKDVVTLVCKYCNNSPEFKKPAGMIYDGAMASCGRGDWFYTRRIISL